MDARKEVRGTKEGELTRNGKSNKRKDRREGNHEKEREATEEERQEELKSSQHLNSASWTCHSEFKTWKEAVTHPERDTGLPTRPDRTADRG